MLSSLMTVMVAENVAVYEPPKQTRVVSLYWRLWKNVGVPHPWVNSAPSSHFMKFQTLSFHRRFLAVLCHSYSGLSPSLRALIVHRLSELRTAMV
jgi:hypothetical protein